MKSPATIREAQNNLSIEFPLAAGQSAGGRKQAVHADTVTLEIIVFFNQPMMVSFW